MSFRSWVWKAAVGALVIGALAPAVASADWDEVGGQQIGTDAAPQTGGQTAEAGGFVYTVTADACSCTPGHMIQVWRSDRHFRYWQPVGMELNREATGDGANPTIKAIDGKIYVAWQERSTEKWLNKAWKVYVSRLDVEDEWTMKFKPVGPIDSEFDVSGLATDDNLYSRSAQKPTLAEYHGHPVVGYTSDGGDVAVVRQFDSDTKTWIDMGGTLGVVNVDGNRYEHGGPIEFKLQSTNEGSDLYAVYTVKNDGLNAANLNMNSKNVVVRKFVPKNYEKTNIECGPVGDATGASEICTYEDEYSASYWTVDAQAADLSVKPSSAGSQQDFRDAGDLTTASINDNLVIGVSAKTSNGGREVRFAIPESAHAWKVTSLSADAAGVPGSQHRIVQPTIAAMSNGDVYAAAEIPTGDHNQTVVYRYEHGTDHAFVTDPAGVRAPSPLSAVDAPGLAEAVSGNASQPVIINRADGNPMLTLNILEPEYGTHVRAVSVG